MADHKAEPARDFRGIGVGTVCVHCGRGINVMRERRFTAEEVAAANRYGSVITWRHNPGPGYPHPRRRKT